MQNFNLNFLLSLFPVYGTSALLIIKVSDIEIRYRYTVYDIAVHDGDTGDFCILLDKIIEWHSENHFTCKFVTTLIHVHASYCKTVIVFNLAFVFKAKFLIKQ
jgi:hypothetical protein